MMFEEEFSSARKTGHKEGYLIGRMQCVAELLEDGCVTYAAAESALDMNEVELRAWFQLGFDDLLT